MRIARCLSSRIEIRTCRASRSRAVCGALSLAAIIALGPATASSAAQTPAAPATLRAAAHRSHLLIGTAADSQFLSESLYSSTLASQYDQLEPENEMKFGPIHPAPSTYNYAGPDALVAFAQAHSMKVRGHNLVWHEQLPDWVIFPKVPWTTPALNRALQEHIANVVGHFKGKVYAWDVVNEPFNEDGTLRSTVWYNQPGIGFAGQGTRTIEQALRWAHAADPAAKLFVNEIGAETLNRKSDAVYAMAKDFVKRGVPLSGIGLEMHIGPGFDQPDMLDSLSRNMRRLAALGLEVQVTELDVRLPNGNDASLSEQAHTYAHVLTLCLHQPACTAFQTWGFTDAHSWIPEENHGFGWALPFDRKYKKKPAWFAIMNKLDSRDGDRPRSTTSR